MLEVSASGGYSGIVWSRDGNAIGTTAAPALLSEFILFFEIFVREPTTTSDYGAYDIIYSGAGGVGTTILVVPPGNTDRIPFLLYIFDIFVWNLEGDGGALGKPPLKFVHENQNALVLLMLSI